MEKREEVVSGWIESMRSGFNRRDFNRVSELLQQLSQWDTSLVSTSFTDLLSVLYECSCCSSEGSVEEKDKYIINSIRHKVLKRAYEQLIPCCSNNIAQLCSLFDSIVSVGESLLRDCTLSLDLFISNFSLTFETGKQWLTLEDGVVKFFSSCLQSILQFDSVGLNSVKSFVNGVLGTLSNLLLEKQSGWGQPLQMYYIERAGTKVSLGDLFSSVLQEGAEVIKKTIELLGSPKINYNSDCKEQFLKSSSQLVSICDVCTIQAISNASWKALLTLSKLGSPLSIDFSPIIDKLCGLVERKITTEKEADLPKFFRMSLLVLVGICKAHFQFSLSWIKKVSFLTILVRSKLPPSFNCAITPAQATQIVEATIPALEGIITKYLASGSDCDEKWSIMSCFKNSPGDDESISMAKLHLVVSILGSKELTEVSLHTKMIECLDWIFENIPRCTAILTYHSIQLSTSLWMRVHVGLCKFCVKLQAVDRLGMIENSLIKYSFSKHFLVRHLSSSIWAFLVRHSSPASQKRHAVLINELLRIQCQNFENKALLLSIVEETLYPITMSLSEEARNYLFQMMAPKPLPADGFVVVAIKISLLPANLFKEELRDLMHDLLGKISGILDAKQMKSFASTFACVRCLRSIVAVVDIFTRTQKQQLISFVLQLLPKAILFSHPVILSLVIETIPALLSDMKPAEQLLPILTHLEDLLNKCTYCKIEILKVLAVCFRCDIAQSPAAAAIKAKVKSLYQKLISDSSWVVQTEALKSFREFAKLKSSSNPRDFIDPSQMNMVIRFIKGEPPALGDEEDNPEALKRNSILLLEHCNRKRPLSDAMENGSKQPNKKQLLSKAVDSIQEGFRLLDTITKGTSKESQLRSIQEQFEELVMEIS